MSVIWVLEYSKLWMLKTAHTSISLKIKKKIKNGTANFQKLIKLSLRFNKKVDLIWVCEEDILSFAKLIY